jgi:dihydroflavonol-4-reductase
VVTSELVLVTGADGFLGSNLVRRLLETGYQVRAFLEAGRETDSMEALPVERRRGDILRLEDLSQAAGGCSYMIHAAASMAVWPTRSAEQDRLNIQGTENAIAVALRMGLERFIHVGAANTFEPGTRAQPGVEGELSGNTRYRLGYIDSKREAHSRVIEAVRRQGLPALVVAPCFMIGPYDRKPQTRQLILSVAQRRMIGVPPGGRNFVHVADVAAGIVSALRRGAVGESYIAGHENLCYAELFELIAEVLQVPPPRLRLPRTLVLLVGLAGSAAGKITGVAPLFSYPVARISCDGQYYCCAKAVRELGLPQTPLRTAIQDAVHWLAAEGSLPLSCGA